MGRLEAQIQVISLAAAAFLASVAPSVAGPTSSVGTITDEIGIGYAIVGGSDLGSPATHLIHNPTPNNPYSSETITVRSGTLYLSKNRDVLICTYTIVTENTTAAAAPSGPDGVAYGPKSQCYSIK